MTDHDIKQSLVEQYLSERVSQYDRFFSSPLWKKSLQPYLKALHEISVNRVLSEKDHVLSDIQKGISLNQRDMLNLPKFIAQLGKTNTTNQDGEEKLPGPITDYMDDFEELRVKSIMEYVDKNK